MADVEVTFTDKSQSLLDKMERRVPVILEACGMEAERYAKEAARVDTGRYRASITHAVSGKGGQVHQYSDNQGNSFTEQIAAVPESEQAVYVGTNVEYALPLEQLDHTIKNAIADHISDYKKIIEEGFADLTK